MKNLILTASIILSASLAFGQTPETTITNDTLNKIEITDIYKKESRTVEQKTNPAEEETKKSQVSKLDTSITWIRIEKFERKRKRVYV